MTEPISIATQPLARTIPVYPMGLRPGEGPNVNDAVERQIRDGMGWRFSKLDDWTTEHIFETINGLGVKADEWRFRDLAAQYRSISDLADYWLTDFPSDDLWSDFFYISAMTLWERLTPDIPCPEVIADNLMQCAAWLDGAASNPMELKEKFKTFLDYLESLPQDETAIQYNQIEQCCDTEISWVCEMAIASFGDDDPEEAERACRIMRIANPENLAPVLGALSELYLRLGRVDEARALLEELHRLDPESVETHITTAIFCIKSGDDAGMVEHTLAVLRMEQETRYWDPLHKMFQDLFTEFGKKDEFALVERQVQRPAPPVPLTTRFAAALPKPIAQSKRVGRNDPCPCGSGKKYKKCHG